MVFSSITFLIFFLPVLLFVYYLADNRYKNIILLVFSAAFYAWGAPKFIFVILLTTFVDFHFVKWLYDTNNPKIRKLLFLASLSINLGLLFYFKYCNFFIENANRILTEAGVGTFPLLNVVLPIGISFYTFESITYMVDVYRRVHAPLRKFWEYQLYIIFFPKLIAGPIVRYHEIADQINGRFSNHRIDDKLLGFNRFCIGLAKKVLIANVVGKEADAIFQSDIHLLSSWDAWIGALAYTMQIYFDFSGYSDMAIGLARMFGFRLPENFNNPYISKSITEFWRRWHITLGSWMKNYLYIPLGGNKVKSNARLYFNLVMVFAFSGLWHGAHWVFIIWGLYHGLWMVLERLIGEERLQKIPAMLRIAFSFFVVVIGWVFFRVEYLSKGIAFIQKMFSFDFNTHQPLEKQFVIVFIAALLFSFSTLFSPFRKIEKDMYYASALTFSKMLLYSFAALILFILCVSSIASSDFNPFIYFRF